MFFNAVWLLFAHCQVQIFHSCGIVSTERMSSQLEKFTRRPPQVRATTREVGQKLYLVNIWLIVINSCIRYQFFLQNISVFPTHILYNHLLLRQWNCKIIFFCRRAETKWQRNHHVQRLNQCLNLGQ